MNIERQVLSEYIRRYYQEKLGVDDRQVFQHDMEHIIDAVNLKQITLRIDSWKSKFFIGKLKTKISKLLGNIIDPEYFVFTSKFGFCCIDENIVVDKAVCHIIWPNKSIPSKVAFSMIGSHYTFYHVKIFDVGNVPLPMQFDDHPTKSIKFWILSTTLTNTPIK